MTTLCIIGVSRGIGLETAKEAVRRGWSVRGLARNPAGGGLSGQRITLLSGDARDRVRVAETLEGSDAAVSAIGLGPTSRRVTLFSDSISVLIRAMEAQGVRRLVAVTGIGAGNSRGKGGWFYDWIVMPFVLHAVYADKDREERLIEESPLDWTIVRPGMLTNAKPTGSVLALTDPAQHRMGRISRADVARFICDAIAEHRFIHEAPVVVGAPRASG
jgi:putative NADH-flavin reductase